MSCFLINCKPGFVWICRGFCSKWILENDKLNWDSDCRVILTCWQAQKMCLELEDLGTLGTLMCKTLHLCVFCRKWKCKKRKIDWREVFLGKADFVRILMMYLGYLTAKTADVISFEKKPFSPPLLSLPSLSSRTVFNSTSTSWKMRLERYHQRQLADCSLSLTLPFSSPFRLLHVCQVAHIIKDMQ